MLNRKITIDYKETHNFPIPYRKVVELLENFIVDVLPHQGEVISIEAGVDKHLKPAYYDFVVYKVRHYIEDKRTVNSYYTLMLGNELPNHISWTKGEHYQL